MKLMRTTAIAWLLAMSVASAQARVEVHNVRGSVTITAWDKDEIALGGSLDNAIVIGDTGPLNVLRFDDEFVRHKILDAVGDLALLGRPVLGHVVAHRAGHALHTQLAKQLLSEADAWTVIENVAAAAAEPDAVPVAARAR